MPRKTVARRSLKAKGAAAAATVAACAQAPALRTSGTEGSLTLSASLLCAGDEDDEDEDEDDDETSENDAAREDDDYETAFRGSREMRDAYSGHGAGRSRRACAQYAPYIDKFKCWAKRTRRMIKNSTVVKTMTLWLTTQLLGDEELDFSKPPRMKKGNFKLHVHAMQYELKHGRDDDGNHRDPDCVVTLSKTAPVRNMFEAIERFHGLRMQQDEEPVLANTHEVGTREMILGGSFRLAFETASRFRKGTRKSPWWFPLNGRALWLTQDGECARGGELLQRSHLGGMHVAPKYASIGPSDPLNIVFTHNVGKTNQEAQYPEYVRVYDATDEMLLASGTLAVCDALVVLSEYHKIELVDETWPCGWQYINMFQPARLPAKEQREREPSKWTEPFMMSESSHDDMQRIVLSHLTEQVGLETKKVRHFLRSASAKRKIMEHGDKVAQEKDMRYDPSPFERSYGQQIVHAKTVASSCFGDEREIARDRLGLSVFIGRRTVAVPEEIKKDTLFPSFRKQMQSSEWKNFINKKGHSREAHEFENVLNKLDADCVKDYAMLRAQGELYVEDPSNVPTWERAKIDPDDVKLTFDNHPVWAHLHKRHPETFPGLVGEMRTVWKERTKSLAEAKLQVAEFDLTRMQETVSHLHMKQMEMTSTMNTLEAEMRAGFGTILNAVRTMCAHPNSARAEPSPSAEAAANPAHVFSSALAATPDPLQASEVDIRTSGVKTHQAVRSEDRRPLIWAKSKDYKLPSDVFNAYHEGSHDLRRAQLAVAEPGYSHRYNASHVKTWDKYRHLVYNVIREVVDDERWSSTRDVETQTDADTQTRAGSATETAAAPSRETVLRRRLGTILERKDKEFSEWRRDTTDPTKTLMRWLTHAHAGYGKDKKAPRKWRPRHIWSELKEQNQTTDV
jgi:hypothetical protein